MQRQEEAVRGASDEGDEQQENEERKIEVSSAPVPRPPLLLPRCRCRALEDMGPWERKVG